MRQVGEEEEPRKMLKVLTLATGSMIMAFTEMGEYKGRSVFL